MQSMSPLNVCIAVLQDKGEWMSDEFLDGTNTLD